MATRKKTAPETEEQKAGGEESPKKQSKAAAKPVTARAIAPQPKKSGKLVKKDKHRLPRKEKKRAKKALLTTAP